MNDFAFVAISWVIEARGERLKYYCEGIEVEPELIRTFVADAVSCRRVLDQSAT